MIPIVRDAAVLLEGRPLDDVITNVGLRLLGDDAVHLTGLYIGDPDGLFATSGEGANPLSSDARLLHVMAADEPRMLASRLTMSEDSFMATTCGRGRWTFAGKVEDVLRELRCHDIIVAGQSAGAAITATSVEQIVVNAGRPVLVFPYIYDDRALGERDLARRILIAWNGTQQAARALADAIPFLKRADVVTVLTIESGPQAALAEQTSLDAVIAHLNRHGVAADAHVARAGSGLHVVDILLNQVADNDYDLLVMGAYSRSQLRESVFGGASRDIFDHMTVPVLTGH